MPLIKKIHDNVLGEFKVNFSVKHNRFEFAELTTPTGYHKYELMYSWEDVEKQIGFIKEATIHESKYIAKKIYIIFKSSEGQKITKDELFIDDDRDVLSYCDVGFELKWYVCDEFSNYNDKVNLYKIIESHAGNQTNYNHGKINILPQLLHGGREFDYTDELYNFLIDSSNKLKTIIKHMADFINPDDNKFLDNINNSQLKLN